MTRVRTLEPSSGTATTYWRIEKRAVHVSYILVDEWVKRHTWNDHGLTTHDENDLHRTKLSHIQLLAQLNGKAQLDDEDGAEEADADGDDDGSSAFQPLEGILSLEGHDVNGTHDGQGEAEPDGDHSHKDGRSQEQLLIPASNGSADDLNLQDQRDLHEDDDQESKDDPEHGAGVGGRGGSGVVVGEVRVDPDELAGEVEDLAEQAGDIADQGQGVEPEDGGTTLLGSGQEDQDDKQDKGRPELAAIVDADADAVLHEVVHQDDWHIELAAIGIVHGDVLRERVEVGHGWRWFVVVEAL